MESKGTPYIDFPEDPAEDAVFGRGKIEDFTWKGWYLISHLHRVRLLPVAVPGLEHRQAVVAQAPHHGSARHTVREGAPSSAREGHDRRRPSSTRGRPGTGSRRASRSESGFPGAR